MVVEMAETDNFQATRASSTTAYNYQRLDRDTNQIRLIKIGPLSEKENLHLDVETFELSAAPPFSALSYTWGNSPADYRIYVNDELFMVRENLFRFLNAFRPLSSEQTYIWIEQICIDQSNVLERNHQVHLMGRIYSMSECVIVWLGDESKTRLWKNYVDAARSFNDKPNTHGLAVFLGDEYFQRLWIVQEILLAQAVKVLILDIWISWDRILATTTNNRVALEQRRVAPGTLSLLQMSESPSSRPRKLESYLAEFAVNGCADLRDKIYGFMGLVDEQHRLDIDYSKTVYEVYQDVFTTCNSSLAQKFGPYHYPSRPYECDIVLEHLRRVLGKQYAKSRARTQLF
ncbi:heterokaryon incompatibility protein-domain-containing protein [Paraphoma chrysanthemicola]|uniref:Heterokaryon incompatibility protein-domain-containing protein n=1 Tax=Paraphoma chrysanthemicola TaxID=798071 RepID=A0A8K0RBJ5_9PLEO|nr:heterokaryon incompatibility protein-domain-containing protein [Paraphoma chrysanthemicola]